MSEETLMVKKTAVLEAMKQCPQAKAVLETIFGEQVKPEDEWKEVSLSDFHVGAMNSSSSEWQGVYAKVKGGEAPFRLVRNEASDYRDEYKIENGKIYRRYK